MKQAGIPTFVSFREHRQHIVLHMAAVFRSWARSGFTEGISGHISVRDPEFGELMWMNPIGKHFALLNGRDMLCLSISKGDVVGGNRVSEAGKILEVKDEKMKGERMSECRSLTRRTNAKLPQDAAGQQPWLLHSFRDSQGTARCPGHLPRAYHGGAGLGQLRQASRHDHPRHLRPVRRPGR